MLSMESETPDIQLYQPRGGNTVPTQVFTGGLSSWAIANLCMAHLQAERIAVLQDGLSKAPVHPTSLHSMQLLHRIFVFN